MLAEKIVMLWSSKIYKILIYAMRFTQPLVSVCISILPNSRRPNSVSVTFLPGSSPTSALVLIMFLATLNFVFPWDSFLIAGCR